MRRLWAAGPVARRGPWLLAPVVGLAAVVGVLAMALVAFVTLGLALLVPGRRRARVFRFGGPATAPAARARAAGDTAAPPRDDVAGGEPAGARAAKPRSYAEVVEAWPLVLAAALLAPGLAHAKLLVPMDDSQANHLKAYGLAYWVLQRGEKCEWLLNYRGGSFLLPEQDAIAREANIRGVTVQPVSGAEESRIRANIADDNMESVNLEKAPRVAVYIPPNNPPWDDAVSMALQYADIPYTKIWDEEVLRGELTKFDWLHLHHEDFTGQHGKFWASYHQFPWYQEEERVQKAMAARLGFKKVPQLKGAVAIAIKDYVARGGFMFGMCSATDTYDIALAGQGLDIVDVIYDGDPPEAGAHRRLDFSRTLAFRDFRLEMDPILYRFSDIDMTQEAAQRGPNQLFTLFDFSAKNDPVPTMLVQNHVNGVAEFLGQSTGFRRTKLKPGVLVLAEVEGTDEVKYLHGQFGQGTFTWLGGHDPEDYQHMVGDPETKLEQFPHSPGYRLILNNVLFPAAEKKKQRT
jgi:hypothetical protein